MNTEPALGYAVPMLVILAALPMVAIVAAVVSWPHLHAAGHRAWTSALLALLATLPGGLLVMEGLSMRELVGRRGYAIEDQHFLGLAAVGLLAGPYLLRKAKRLVLCQEQHRVLRIIVTLCWCSWCATGLYAFMCMMAV